MEEDNQKRKLKIAYRILLAAAAGIFIVSACVVLSFFHEENKEEDAYAEVRAGAEIRTPNPGDDTEPAKALIPAENTAGKLRKGFDLKDGMFYYDPDFTDAFETEGNKDIHKLQESYPDIDAWLYIPGTNISYPVMGAADDAYLTKNYKGQQAKSGSLYAYRDALLDPGNKNITVFGHNMKNGSMFGSLKAYLLVDGMFEGAGKIYWAGAEGVTEYKIFSVYISPADGRQSEGYFGSESGYLEYLQECADKSVLAPGAAPAFSGDSRILTLSTCTSLMGAGENDRLIIQAVSE